MTAITGWRRAPVFVLAVLAVLSACSLGGSRGAVATPTAPSASPSPTTDPTGLWDGDWDRLFAIVNQITVAQLWAADPSKRPEHAKDYRTIVSRVITKPGKIRLPDLSDAKEFTVYVTCHGEHPFRVTVLDRHDKMATYYGGSSCGGEALSAASFPISKLDKASRAHASLQVSITRFVPYTLSVFIVPRYLGRA